MNALQIFFQTSVRALSTAELANDEEAVARLRGLYDTLDNATTPASVLMPWFPSPSMISKLVTTIRIFLIVNRAVSRRVRDQTTQDDALQVLIDNSDHKLTMVGVRHLFHFLR